MADFSRIRVTPAEEEDIVIMAGVVEDVRTAPASDAVRAHAPSDEGEVAFEAMTPEESAPPAHRERAPYQETTLEDLQHAHMSGMQKAVIALAIFAVAAFIIWYVFLR